MELYLIVMDLNNARVIALILSGLLSLGVVGWVLDNVKKRRQPMTNLDTVTVYLFGFVSFISGVLVMGLLVVPKNADNLMEAIMVRNIVDGYTYQVQKALIFCINLVR